VPGDELAAKLPVGFASGKSVWLNAITRPTAQTHKKQSNSANVSSICQLKRERRMIAWYPLFEDRKKMLAVVRNNGRAD
jgi:hypothetical protein